MLVLTRKVNQSITLGQNIRIAILSVEGDRVSIGIDAPQDVRIFRSELIEDTMNTNKESQDSVYFSPAAMKKKIAADTTKS